MDIGIPKYASASGGNYFYRDGRDVPDVWQATLEYPDMYAGTPASKRNLYPKETGGGPGLTVLYSATLSSNYSRGNRIMGHDATMMMGGQSNVGNVGGFIVTADSSSTEGDPEGSAKGSDSTNPALLKLSTLYSLSVIISV